MRKISDRFALGAVAGTAGALAAYLMGAVAKKMGYDQRTWVERGKALVISEPFGSSRAAVASGFMVSEAIGVLAAIPLVYIQSMSGRDKALAKGAIYGSLTWLAFYGLGQRATGVFRSTPSAAMSNLATNLVYGVVTASVISGLGHDKLFRAAGASEGLEDADTLGEGISEWAKDNQVLDERTVH